MTAVVSAHGTPQPDLWNHLRTRLGEATVETWGWQVPGTVPYLLMRPVDLKPIMATLVVESVLTLPGSEPQTVRVSLPCHCTSRAVARHRVPLVFR